MSVKKDILKEIMLHRQRVSLKLSTIANDIAANGRRHDNSYTGDTEYALIEKITKEKDPTNKAHYIELLNSVHEQNNDYYPEYNYGIENMNMLQLLELIADKIVRIEEREDRPSDVNDYKREIISSLGHISGDLQGVIENTIEYFIDRNKAILKIISKKVADEASQRTFELATDDNKDGGINYGA